MTYNISLEVFEGPLDLLLHLIRKNKLEIYDIPISLVTDQYLEYIEAMKELDIEVASEFLVTAATLLSIKAKMLLPKHTDEEEEEELDPRSELVARLLEYEKYKSVINVFQEMETKSSRIFFKPVDEELINDLAAKTNPLENVDFQDLSKLFLEVLDRVPEVEESEIREIAKKEITVGGAMKSLEKLLLEKEEIYFIDTIYEGITKYEVVVNFLAVLELIRKDFLFARQVENFGRIKLIIKKDEKVM